MANRRPAQGAQRTAGGRFAPKTTDELESSTTVDDRTGGNNAGGGLSALAHPPPLPPPSSATSIPQAVAPTQSSSDAPSESGETDREGAPDQPVDDLEASTIANGKPTQSSSQPSTPRTGRSTDTRVATRPGPNPVQTPPKTPKKIIHIHDIETNKTVDKFLMGTAVLCVAALDPIWPVSILDFPIKYYDLQLLMTDAGTREKMGHSGPSILTMSRS
jgi:hypothetical protein